MAEQQVQRRLAAILAADVVGYSALIQRAEEATYAEFERLKREVIEPDLTRHDGDEVRAYRQLQDCQGARSSAAGKPACPSQRGDRIEM